MTRFDFTLRNSLFALVVLTCGFSPIGIAGRVMLSLPVSIPSQRFDFQVGSMGEALPNGPNKTRYGDPQRIGGSLMFDLKLVNISNVKQTGSVEIVRKAVAARTTCGDAGIVLAFKGLIYLCGPLGSIVGTEFGGNIPFNSSTSVPPAPGKVNFILMPDDDAVVSLRYLFYSVFGDVPSGCRAGWAALSASFKVNVNEDQGAIIGSVTPRVASHSPSLPNGSTFQLCGIPPYHQLSFAGNYPDSAAGLIPLNGGRPF